MLEVISLFELLKKEGYGPGDEELMCENERDDLAILSERYELDTILKWDKSKNSFSPL